MAPKTKIIQDEDGEPIGVEIIAAAIVELSAGMKRIESSRLTRRAIVTLLHDSTRGLTRNDIETVLNALDGLERTYLKPKPAAIKK